MKKSDRILNFRSPILRAVDGITRQLSAFTVREQQEIISYVRGHMGMIPITAVRAQTTNAPVRKKYTARSATTAVRPRGRPASKSVSRSARASA